LKTSSAINLKTNRSARFTMSSQPQGFLPLSITQCTCVHCNKCGKELSGSVSDKTLILLYQGACG
jgi:hypothetical protein